MKKLVLVVMMLLVSLPIMAQTPPSRVAVINVQKVLAESNAGKTAYEKLKKMQDERGGRLQKLEEELKRLDAEIVQKKTSLKDEKLVELNRQVAEKKINMQRFAQDADREMTEARDRTLQDLERQLMPIINNAGKEMGFAAIFNKFESGLIYASEAIDITDIVVKRFNEATGTATPAPAKK